MPQHSAFLPIASMMFVAGIGIPVMATLNAGLGRSLESPVAATVCLFATCLVLALAALAITGGPPVVAKFAAVPWPYYIGAIFMAGYALSITWAAPRIGVGNAVFFVLLGQLVAAAAIDHFGFLGAIRSTLTVKRTIGIAVMAFGVYLAKKPA